MLSSGFAVSPYKGREVIIDELNDENIRKYIYDNFDLLINKENNLGGWYNKENGKFYLDVSVVKDSFEDAFSIAAKK